jgi:hypothetical protein
VSFIEGILDDLERIMIALLLANITTFFVTLILTIGRGNKGEFNKILGAKDIKVITTA